MAHSKLQARFAPAVKRASHGLDGVDRSGELIGLAPYRSEARARPVWTDWSTWNARGELRDHRPGGASIGRDRQTGLADPARDTAGERTTSTKETNAW
jgi:hypothetical protein